MIKKQLGIEEYKEIDDEVIEILASDETLDRDNDIIKADGWDFNGWLKTGSLLYGHNPSNLPVGSAEKAEIRDGRLYLYSKLAKKGTSEWHDTIRSLIDQKILKGVSVGFVAKDYQQNDQGGRTFTKQELLEISLTPIPANANARVVLRAFNKDIAEKLISIEDNNKDNIEEEAIEKEVEETLVVEPQEDPRVDKFLNLYNKLRTILGE